MSAGGEVDLLVEKLNDLIDQGLSFEEVVEAITAYQEKTKLLFVLAKVDKLGEKRPVEQTYRYGRWPSKYPYGRRS